MEQIVLLNMKFESQQQILNLFLGNMLISTTYTQINKMWYLLLILNIKYNSHIVLNF